MFNKPVYSRSAFLYFEWLSRIAVAKDAKKLIDELTGLRVFVTPVVCAVGWYAKSTDLYGNPVLFCMEKTLKSVIPKVEPRMRLEESDRNKIISALDRLYL